MKISAFIARRLSLGGSNRTASVIAVAGVACTTCILLLTVAISLGFKREIRSRLSGFMPQITLNAPYALAGDEGADSLQLDDDMRSAIRQGVPGASVSLAVRTPGMLKTDTNFATQIFTAYDPAHDFTFERGNLTRGKWLSGDTSIVVSGLMASKLDLEPGSRITAYFFVNGSLRARRLTVAGVYASHFGNYDNTVCYVSPSMLQQLHGWRENTGTSIELNGIDAQNVDAATLKLYGVINGLVGAGRLHTSLTIDNINQTGAMYLNWLELLDTNVVVIFILMSCVSALTLISCLFILILNNVPSIAIFRALGMPRNAIRGVFRRLTMRLVATGMLFGNVFAIIFICVQGHFHIMPLNPEMYYITFVPVHLTWPVWLLINAGIAVASWLIILLPARLATSISVTTAMRYD